MKEEFKKFVNTFDIEEEFIYKKYTHSLRVQKLCEKIAKDENFNKKEYKLSSVVGLLHDYGRFYQWSKFKTFNDDISIDHGDYAVKELFDNNQINKYYKIKRDYKIIYEAIKYHNKYEVPNNVVSSKICNIIRDADKLDIMEMYTINELKLKEKGNISKKVKDSFYKHELIKNKDMNDNIDITIRTLSLVYDLNYNYSYKYLKENKIIEKMYNSLKNKEKLKPYFEKTKKYIERKIGDEKC